MGTLWVHCEYIVSALWVHCEYIVSALWVHCEYIVSTLWLQDAPHDQQDDHRKRLGQDVRDICLRQSTLTCGVLAASLILSRIYPAGPSELTVARLQPP